LQSDTLIVYKRAETYLCGEQVAVLVLCGDGIGHGRCSTDISFIREMTRGELVCGLAVVHRLDQLWVHKSALGDDAHDGHHLVQMRGKELPWGQLMVPKFTCETNL
jgi:hypothetical protein